MMKDSNLKTVEGQFLQELEKEFGFTPVVARAVLRRSKDVLGGQDFQEDPPRIGQMKVLVVASREPAGKPLSQCRIVPVTVTLDADEEDLEVLGEGGTLSRVAPAGAPGLGHCAGTCHTARPAMTPNLDTSPRPSTPMSRKRFSREGYERKTPPDRQIVERPPRPVPEEPRFPCPRCNSPAVERLAVWERGEESADEPVLWCPSCERGWWQGEELVEDDEWDRLSVMDGDEEIHLVYERVPRRPMPSRGPR